MDNDAFRKYLEDKDFEYDDSHSSYYWVQKKNPGTPFSTVPKDPWLDPVTVRKVCDNLGKLPYPPGI
jgi:hypothetical protein